MKIKNGFLTYSVIDRKASVIECERDASGELVIPSEIEGYPVVDIGRGAFNGNSELTGVIIPDCVEKIGESAFCCCTALKSVALPKALRIIEASAFSDCEALTEIGLPDGLTVIESDAFIGCEALTEINLPESVRSIGEMAFSHCESLSRVTIPKGVTVIENSVFQYCVSLVSVQIPEGVTVIEDWAFGHCASLSSITIPDSVTEIGGCALSYCVSLESINVSDNNEYYSVKDGVLYSKDKRELIAYALGNTAKSIDICDGVERVGFDAFAGSVHLERVTIPESVLEIEPFAFSRCKKLESIDVSDNNPHYFTNDGVLYAKGESKQLVCYPTGRRSTEYRICDGVTEIASHAFFYCSNLKRIHIPDSVTDIGSDAFSGCTSLEEVNIPEGITDISYKTFAGCVSLTSIIIPTGVLNIEPRAFIDCKALRSIIIPESVKRIGLSFNEEADAILPSSVFRGCDNLTIYCEAGTYAERYAVRKKLKYQIIGDVKKVQTAKNGEKK